jgi:hypothetical protein
MGATRVNYLYDNLGSPRVEGVEKWPDVLAAQKTFLRKLASTEQIYLYLEFKYVRFLAFCLDFTKKCDCIVLKFILGYKVPL